MPARSIQQQLWLLQHLVPDRGVINIASKLTWRGDFSPLALQEALLDLAVRHPYFRVTVEYRQHQLVQVRHPAQPVDVRMIDLRGAPAEKRRREMCQAAQVPLPLDLVPGIRATVFRLADELYEVSLVVSHLVSDGISMAVLCADVLRAYAARRVGQPPQWVGNAEIDIGEECVVNHAPDSKEDRPPRFDLPYDWPPPSHVSYRGCRIVRVLGADESHCLADLSRQQGVTPFVTWLSLMQAVAYGYSRQSTMEIEIPLSGRTRAMRRFVGPLMQSAHVQLTASDVMTFAELLQANAAHVDRIGETTTTGVATRRAQLLLDYQSALDELRLNDRESVLPGEMDNGVALAELRLGIRRRRRTFDLQIDYDVERFRARTAGRFFEHLRRTLLAVGANPSINLGELDFRTDAEKTVVQRVNQTDRSWTRHERLVDVQFDRQVARTPDAPAIVDDGGSLTWRQLADGVNSISSELERNRIGRGDRVALLMERNRNAVASMLAILKCGAAFLPVDVHYPAYRQSLILGSARPHALLVDGDRRAEKLREARTIDVTRCWNADTNGPVQQRDRAGRPRDDRDLAYILFTSGSTGVPKGVEITHANLVNFFAAMDELQDDVTSPCWLAVTSISFDISMFELLYSLTRGFKVVIEDDPLGLGNDQAYFHSRCRDHKATHFQCTPALIQQLVNNPCSRRALSTLRYLFVGGDVMSPEVARELAQLTGVKVFNMYGPTETTVWSTAWQVSPDFENVLIGKPVANTRVHVLDAQQRPVPMGVVGELYISGSGVAKGYFAESNLTGRRFVAAPDGGKMFRTGDFVRMMPDGQLQFVGRRDQQVKLDGHRIELAEIESTLRSHPAIDDAVAVCREINQAGLRIVAFVTLRARAVDQQEAILQREVYAAVREKLPGYMIPDRIVALDKLPITAAGKVDRQQLTKLLLSPDSDQHARTWNSVSRQPSQNRCARPFNGSDSLPSDAVERIESVLCDELRLDQLPSGKNLLEMGVDSLQAVHLSMRIEREFGVRLPVAKYFHTRSLKDLVVDAVLEGRDHAETGGARPNRQTSRPGTSEQEEMPCSTRAAIDADASDPAMERLVKAAESVELAPDDPELHPFARLVEPVKSELLSRAGLDIVFTRGNGVRLWDAEGNEYLDFVAQYGALPFGYNPPEIWEAVEQVRWRQLPNLATGSILDSAGRLAEQLLAICPGMRHVVFCNSGAECSEVAIKLCRSTKGRMGIASTIRGFHGLTTGAASVTGSRHFRDGFVSDRGNFHHVPFGDIEAAAQLLQRNGKQIAALFVEPIQGEAGVIVPPSGYLPELRALCDRHDVLMVVDEIQTGLGRTGRMLACQQADIEPDVVLLAKALGGGLMPIGAVLCRPRAYNRQFGLKHSSTFGGNAVACQVGLATLARLQQNDHQLLQHVVGCGQHLVSGLEDLQTKHHDLIVDVRGRGLMQAVEFDFTSFARGRRGLMEFLAEQQTLIHLIASQLLHVHGVRVAPSFMGRQTIRIEPPLIIEHDHCEQLVRALDATLQVVRRCDTAALLAPMAGVNPRTFKQPSRDSARSAKDRSAVSTTSQPVTRQTASRVVAEFGFLVHMNALDDLVKFDDSLSAFTQGELKQLKERLARTADPFVIGTADFHSASGSAVRGHFVMIPHTPAELQSMADDHCIRLVNQSAEVARDAGVALIGLGGFTSIVSMGGAALNYQALPPVTSGNSLTAGATIELMRHVCRQQGILPGCATGAVVGAAGQTGRALAVLMAEQVERLILVGRRADGVTTSRRLLDVALAVVTHLRHSSASPTTETGTLWMDARSFDLGSEAELLDKLIADERIILSEGTARLSQADVIVTATSATEPFIESGHLKPCAIVIDSSRPTNVSDRVRHQRPDVQWVEGGIIHLSQEHCLDIYAGPAARQTFACVAEAALWALEPQIRSVQPEILLDPRRIRNLVELSHRHGFRCF